MPGLWLNLNIVLAVLVVCLSGVLRTADKTPKEEADGEPAAEPSTALAAEKPFAALGALD